MRLHVVHTHAPSSLRMLRAAKAEGLRVSASCDPKYIHLRDSDMEEQGARAIPGGFVTKDADRMAEVWRSLDDGTIDAIDSDHASAHSRRSPTDGEGPMDRSLRCGTVRSLPCLRPTFVRKIRLGRLVEVLSAAPARILGIYPERE